jgi:hypothetical protein
MRYLKVLNYGKTKAIVYSLVIMFSTSMAWSYSSGPPDGVAGDPPNNANCTQCHGSFGVNSGDGLLQLMNMPAEYEPDSTYTLTINLEDDGQTIWGFEVTAILANGDRAGDLVPIDAMVQVSSSGPTDREYAKQTTAGNQRGSVSASWEFDWTAPSSGSGQVDFYMAGNAGNWNGQTNGDFIYTISMNVPEQILGITDWPANTPQTHTLLTAYPNPFNPEVTMRLEGAPAGQIELEILNLSGQIVAGFGYTNSGNSSFEVPINLSELPSGGYFVRAVYPGGTSIIPLMKLK